MMEVTTPRDARDSITQERQRPHRWFYRCMACLGVWAIEPDDPERFMAALAQETFDPGYTKSCPYCHEAKTGDFGIVEMGRVQLGRVIEDRIKSTCDASCTHALGPMCVCRCHGANHGSGLVIRFTKDRGSEEWAAGQSEASKKYIDRMQRQGAEFITAYRETAVRVEAVVEPLREKRNHGGWLSRDDFYTYYYLPREVRKIKEAKIHKTRMARLQKVNEEVDKWWKARQ